MQRLENLIREGAQRKELPSPSTGEGTGERVKICAETSPLSLSLSRKGGGDLLIRAITPGPQTQ
jgi:hypothetical protein